MTGIKAEIGFLVLFIVLFVAFLSVLNAMLLPRHYNPIIVLMLASIIVGMLTIFVRYLFYIRRFRR